MDCFLLVSYVYIREKDHQMSFKRNTNHLISLNCACFMTIISSFILFYNVNNGSKGFHKLQGYFRFIK